MDYNQYLEIKTRASSIGTDCKYIKRQYRCSIYQVAIHWFSFHTTPVLNSVTKSKRLRKKLIVLFLGLQGPTKIPDSSFLLLLLILMKE